MEMISCISQTQISFSRRSFSILILFSSARAFDTLTNSRIFNIPLIVYYHIHAYLARLRGRFWRAFSLMRLLNPQDGHVLNTFYAPDTNRCKDHCCILPMHHCCLVVRCPPSQHTLIMGHSDTVRYFLILISLNVPSTPRITL